MILRFHEEALREYDKAVLWYAKRSLLAPSNFVAAVDSMVEQISVNPLAFPIVHMTKRKAVLRKFPFYLIFESASTSVIVFAVAHSKRKTKYWRKRHID